MSPEPHTPFALEILTTGHVDSALQLCREAGWNQLRADWLRLLRHEPDGCFAAIRDGQLVGTLTTTCYGEDLAWIGMMLVHPDHRRQGIALSLMRHGIDYLRTKRVRCIKLDATPAGAHVYRKLGFEEEWTFHRWCREGTNAPPRAESNACPNLSEAVLELDRRGFGADRGDYLRRLGQDSQVCVTPTGFGMARPGFLATYLGPVCAATVGEAETIIGKLCAAPVDRMFWDIPETNREVARLADSFGFVPGRQLTRMRLGRELSPPDLKLQFALAGPATG